MRRRYQSGLYRERIEFIKKLIPDAAIGVDVITGHPGETDELFQESFNFIDDLPVTYLHVFTYSERPNTHALDIEPVVQDSVRKERTHKLRRLSKKKRFEFDTSFQRQTRPVLFEKPKENGLMFGWTDNYVRVGIPAIPEFENKILPVELGARTKQNYMNGTISKKTRQEEQVMAHLTG